MPFPQKPAIDVSPVAIRIEKQQVGAHPWLTDAAPTFPATARRPPETCREPARNLPNPAKSCQKTPSTCPRRPGRATRRVRFSPASARVFDWADVGAALTFAPGGQGLGKTAPRGCL